MEESEVEDASGAKRRFTPLMHFCTVHLMNCSHGTPSIFTPPSLTEERVVDEEEEVEDASGARQALRNGTISHSLLQFAPPILASHPHLPSTPKEEMATFSPPFWLTRRGGSAQPYASPTHPITSPIHNAPQAEMATCKHWTPSWLTPRG